MNNSEQLEQPSEFEAVKARLEEIANTVDDENLSLDEALDLYEEAVKLGLQASDLLETGIVIEDEVAPESAGEQAQNPASDNETASQSPDLPQADSGEAATAGNAVS